ncbi:glycosyltransferase family 4 protein [Hydrogenimonas sp.]
MKILIVNTSDSKGGAARAAYRLHNALLQAGIDAHMLVQHKEGDESSVISTSTNTLQKCLALLRAAIDQIPVKLYKKRVRTLFSPAWSGMGSRIVQRINEIDPDIVHLHWVCGGMMTIEDIAKIKKPIVWTLHDSWAFTGGCHLTWECERYTEACGRCTVLGSTRERDLSSYVWRRKKRAYGKLADLTVVGISRWILGASKKSSLLRERRFVGLPNPIDTTVFRPSDKRGSLELWRLPNGRKLILFGAMSATEDRNKGFEELSTALSKLSKADDVALVVFGSSRPRNAPEFGFETYYLGSLSDDVSLVALYSAVDVVVVPSLQENLSNTIMESLSCATPVVAFDTGGNSDMIEHKKNGYLAKPFDAADLAKGIEWVLENEAYSDLCRRAREKVLEAFDAGVVAKKYIQMYRSIVDG